MKTINQVAKSLGVSRQSIYSKLSMLTDNMTVNNEKGVKLITQEGEQFLRQKLSKRTVNRQSIDNINDELISMLKNELKAKDKQILDLNERLREVTTALANEQKLMLIQKQEKLTDNSKLEKPVKRNIFNIFKPKQ